MCIRTILFPYFSTVEFSGPLHLYSLPPTFGSISFDKWKIRRRSSLCTLETISGGKRNIVPDGDGQWDTHIGSTWEITAARNSTYAVGLDICKRKEEEEPGIESNDWLRDAAPCRARSSTRNPLIKVARGAFCRPPWQLPNVSIYLWPSTAHTLRHLVTPRRLCCSGRSSLFLLLLTELYQRREVRPGTREVRKMSGTQLLTTVPRISPPKRYFFFCFARAKKNFKKTKRAKNFTYFG